MEQIISEKKQKEYFAYLNALRHSGKVNMYGAAPYLKEQFLELRHDDSLARQILRNWMEQFEEGDAR